MSSATVASQLLRGRRLAGRWFPLVALIGAVVGVVLVLRSQRDAVTALEWQAAWKAFLLASLAYALPPLAQGASFWLSLRWLTGGTPAGATIQVWARSFVLRYVPTGALAVAYRLRERERMNASADQVLAAYAYEHVAAIGAGAVACLAIFAAAGDLPPLIGLAVAVPALVSVAAAASGLHVVERLARRLGHELSLGLRRDQVAALVGVNAVGWVGTGTAVYLLVDAMVAAGPDARWLVGGYTVGYLVGFVTPLAPGGVGAREGALVAVLATRYGTGPAVAVSLAIRLASVAGELVAVALIEVALAARWLACAARPRCTSPRHAPGVTAATL